MKTLNDVQCSQWLERLRIPRDPYGAEASTAPSHYDRPEPYYEQTDLPQGRVDVLAAIIHGLGSYDFALLHCTDWGLYTPEQMAIFEAVRRAHGEEKWLIKTPGHLFDRSELDLLAGMLSLVKYFAWTAYVYFDNAATVLCWEGEKLDVWAYDEESFGTIKRILNDHAPQPRL